MNTIPQTDQLANLPDNYILVTDSRDVEDIARQYAGEYWQDITAALVLVGDGEYIDVWLSESSRPYELYATYHNPAYYD